MQRLFKRIATGAVCFTMGLAMWGCGSLGNDPVDTTEVPPPQPLPTPIVARTFPQFAPPDPTKIHLPNDLLRPGGNYNLPDVAPFNAEPFLALKSTPCFSTLGSIIIPFSGGGVVNSPHYTHSCFITTLHYRIVRTV